MEQRMRRRPAARPSSATLMVRPETPPATALTPIGRWRHAAAVSAAAAGLTLVAGCSSALDGAGGPAAVASSTSPTSPTSSPTDSRPSGTPLDAAGIDPCALLDDLARTQLGVTDHGPADNSDFDGATCRFVVDEQNQFNATATDGVTLAELVDASNDQGRTTTPTTIRGYDAALSYAPDEPATCTAAVGVSPTGLVVVTYQNTSAAPSDEDDTCGRARAIADRTVDGLISQQ